MISLSKRTVGYLVGSVLIWSIFSTRPIAEQVIFPSRTPSGPLDISAETLDVLECNRLYDDPKDVEQCISIRRFVQPELSKEEFLDCREEAGAKWFVGGWNCKKQCERLVSLHPDLAPHCGKWQSYNYRGDSDQSGPYPRGPYAPFDAEALNKLTAVAGILEAYKVEHLQFPPLNIAEMAQLDYAARTSFVLKEIDEYLSVRNYFKAVQGPRDVVVEDIDELLAQAQNLELVLQHQFGLIASLPEVIPEPCLKPKTIENANPCNDTVDQIVAQASQDWATQIGVPKPIYRVNDYDTVRGQIEKTLESHFWTYAPDAEVSVRQTMNERFQADITCGASGQYSPFFENSVDAFAWVGKLERLNSNFTKHNETNALNFSDPERYKPNLLSLLVNDTIADGILLTCNSKLVQEIIEHKALEEWVWTEGFRAETLEILREALDILERVKSSAVRIKLDIQRGRYVHSFDKRRDEIEFITRPARVEVQARLSLESTSLTDVTATIDATEIDIDLLKAEIDLVSGTEIQNTLNLEAMTADIEQITVQLASIDDERSDLMIKEANMIELLKEISNQDQPDQEILIHLADYTALQGRLAVLQDMWNDRKLQISTVHQSARLLQETLDITLDKRLELALQLSEVRNDHASLLHRRTAVIDEQSKLNDILDGMRRHVSVDPK